MADKRILKEAKHEQKAQPLGGAGRPDPAGHHPGRGLHLTGGLTMADLTNCPNCGAPVDPAAVRCAYCGTPYPRPRKTAQAVAIVEPCTLHIDGTKLVAAIAAGIITPNEARRRLGFREL